MTRKMETASVSMDLDHLLRLTTVVEELSLQVEALAEKVDEWIDQVELELREVRCGNDLTNDE